MATSDMAFERVEALLRVDNGNGSLFDHLARLVGHLVDGKPSDALQQLETFSRHVKQSNFRGVPAVDECVDFVGDPDAEERRLQWCVDALKLLRQPTPTTPAPQLFGSVRSFLDDAGMFAWAGVGFGQQEALQVSLSLKKLAAGTPSLERLRFWGKILGTDGDYYVAEGALRSLGGPAAVATATPPLPFSPEYDVEARGTGANTFTYWVSSSPGAPWSRLPAARASQIVAARQIKHLLTGDLDSPVLSMPWFPGKERHLLRAQIARISATCTLAARGWYEVDEELGENVIREAEGNLESFPGSDELATEGAWVHAAPCLLATGRCTFPDTEALAEVLTEDQIKILDKEREDEGTIHAILETVEADLEEFKPEDGEGGSPAWSIKTFGDKATYKLADVEKSHQVVAVRSLVWPGAVAVAQGTKFANLYVGYGLKCGTLVPEDPKSGLPLRGTSPVSPLVPDDIMGEPEDVEEHDEPNPQDDEAESDKGSVDEPDQ